MAAISADLASKQNAPQSLRSDKSELLRGSFVTTNPEPAGQFLQTGSANQEPGYQPEQSSATNQGPGGQSQEAIVPFNKEHGGQAQQAVGDVFRYLFYK